MTFVLFKKYDQAVYYINECQKNRSKESGVRRNKGRRVTSYTCAVFFNKHNVGCTPLYLQKVFCTQVSPCFFVGCVGVSRGQEHNIIVSSYSTVPEKRGKMLNCYEPVKFTCHIGNVLAAVDSSMNNRMRY